MSKRRVLGAGAALLALAGAIWRPAQGAAQRAARRHSAGLRAGAALAPGGLLAYPSSTAGENLLSNPSFETPGPSGKPLGWSDNGFQLDTTVAHTGAASFRLTDAHLIPYAQSASQQVTLRKGVYEFSGWVRTENLAASQGSGVRICLVSEAGGGCTPIVKGTADWQKLARSKVTISRDVTARLRLEAYAEPDGSAWFDDLELRRQETPLEVFLLYPNYRGYLFSDQSQTARFEVSVEPPAGAQAAAFLLEAAVLEELSGALLMRETYPVEAQAVAALNFSGLPEDRSYLVRFALKEAASGDLLYEHPPWRIRKAPGALRREMTLSFDEHNRFLVRGSPAFLLGVYDAGLGYVRTEAAWEDLLGTQRRLFELPINLYLNYWYGEAPNEAILPLLDALHRRGILALTNANCFAAKPADATPYWFLQAGDAAVEERAAHPAFAGFYAADECRGDLASEVFRHVQRMRTLDPDGVALGTLLGNADLELWRNSVDVLATDPYPLWGPEPAAGYPLSRVAEWTRLSREAVRNSRPVITVLQFFKATATSRWPSEQELRNMSYMAIAEGANGLLYWSLGARALAWVCSGWCEEKIEYFERLKAVMKELKSLEAVLVAVDRPELLASVSPPEAIRTRVKFAGGRAWLIASNVTGAALTASFTWSESLRGVSVFAERRSIPADGAQFSDAFAPYQAHVYAIE